jgi:hypothetical protein
VKRLNPINRALVATLLVLAALFGVRLAQQALREAPGFQVSVSPDAVQTISLTAHDRVLRLERSGEGWNLTLPAESAAPANRAAVARFLTSWQDFQTSYMVSDRGAGGAGFEGSTMLVLLAPEGDSLLALEVGDRLASGERALRKVGDPSVYAGAVAAADLLVADPARWIDRTALVSAAERVVRFGLTNQYGAQVFERVNGRWTRDDGPVRDRGVTQMVLSAIQLGLAPELSTEAVLAAGDAVRVPRISLWWEEQDGHRRVAHLCGDVPIGRRVYLDRETKALFTVPQEELVRFSVRPSDLAATEP